MRNRITQWNNKRQNVLRLDLLLLLLLLLITLRPVSMISVANDPGSAVCLHSPA